MPFRSPDTAVGNQLFVGLFKSRQQTEHVGKRRRGGGEWTAWMTLDVVVLGGGGGGGNDRDVREWFGRDIFQHTLSSLPLIGVPPRWGVILMQTGLRD